MPEGSAGSAPPATLEASARARPARRREEHGVERNAPDDFHRHARGGDDGGDLGRGDEGESNEVK